MPTHITTINLGGLEVECDVDFTIITYPTSPSGYGFDGSFDPGEGGEIEIHSVRSNDTGVCYMALLAATPTGKLVETYDAKVVPPGHWRSIWCAMRSSYPGTGRIDYVTRLTRASTALEDIEAEIREDGCDFDRDDFDRDDFEDYDPRDYAND